MILWIIFTTFVYRAVRPGLGFAACQSKKGNTLIIRLLPLQGEWRCGVVMFTQGVALGYVIVGLSARI